MSYIWRERKSFASLFFDKNLRSQIVTGIRKQSSTHTTKAILRSREYRFTHMNRSTVDIPFLSEALLGERIWVILKVANLMRKVWWLWQEEKEKKEKKLIWNISINILQSSLV